MCKLPSPQLQQLLSQLNKQAAEEQLAAKNRLIAANKAAAREQLLRIQLELARKFPK